MKSTFPQQDVSSVLKAYLRCFLTTSIVYRPNLKTKSDADILRDAKLEAMGLLPEDHEHRPHHDRPQMATDEMVHVVPARYTAPRFSPHNVNIGHGTVQKTYAQVVRF